MQKRIILFIVVSFILSLGAKSEEIISNGFIFPDYVTGRIYFKNNEVVESLLNYETVTKQMLFKQKDQVLALGLPQATDSVVMSGRIFVYFQNCEFFEKIPLVKGSLFVQYNSRLVSGGKASAYGGYSQVSSSSSLNSLSTIDGVMSQTIGHLSPNERFNIDQERVYWIQKGDKFSKVSSRSQLLKAFPDKKSQIQSFLLEHKINWDSLDDMKRLLIYCFSL